jgi:hypothetical protein
MTGYGDGIQGLVILFMIQIPLSILGLWKLIEIIVWIVRNVKVVIA